MKNLSEKAAALPGVEAVGKVKKQVSEAAATVSKKLENRVTNKIAEKAREWDNSAATRIRNSRVVKLETQRQAILAPLRDAEAQKKKSEDKFKKWQERAKDLESAEKWQEQRELNALSMKLQGAPQKKEPLTAEEASAKILRKIEKHQNLSDQATKIVTAERGKNAKSLAGLEKKIDRNNAQLKLLRYKEVNDRLETLTAKQRLLQRELEQAKTEEIQKRIQEKLTTLNEEIKGTVIWASSLVEKKESGKEDAAAIKAMPALQALREKNRVIVRVWLPKDEGHLTSQAAATKDSFFRDNAEKAGTFGKSVAESGNVGHVSLEFPDGQYVSWWPGKRPSGATSIEPGVFLNGPEDDYRAEGGHHPDRAFSLYTLDVDAMIEEFSAVKSKVSEGFGWTVFDNSTLRDGIDLMRRSTRASNSHTDGTSCSGFVNRLLTVGGLHKLLPLPGPGSFFSRTLATSPENITELLEPAEFTENAAHPETRILRHIDKARIEMSGLFKRSFEAVSVFFDSKKQEGGSEDDFDPPRDDAGSNLFL